MAEPLSIKIQPWCDFPRFSYSFITDDFCHTKSLVAKITARTAKSVIKIKESMVCKPGSCAVADEVKMWFDLPNNGSLYTKVKSSDYIKIHYDHGPKQVNNKLLTFYGGINSNKLLNNISLKAGVLHDSQHCHSDNRLKVSLQQNQNENQWHWYHRTTIYHNKYTFGLLGVLDISKKVLQKNAVLFGYRVDEKNQFFLRAQAKGFRKTTPKQSAEFFDFVLADYIKRIDEKSRVGIEAGFDLRGRNLTCGDLVYERSIKKGETVKVGISKDLDLSMVYKRPVSGLEDLAKISIGVGVTGIMKNDVKAKNGFEVSINL